MAEIIDAAPVSSVAATQADIPIDLETTPEFIAWQKATLQEVAEYLASNWNIQNAELVMVPMYTFPDKNNRRAYASVSSGKTFRDADNNIVTNPATNQPMSYAVWRKVEPPPELPSVEDTQPDIEPAFPAT